MGALWIGLLVGVFCFFMVVKVKNIFGYDDSLDAFGVHGAGGTLGAILTGLFARAFINPAVNIDGVFAGNGKQLLNQITGVAIAWGLSIVGTLALTGCASDDPHPTPLSPAAVRPDNEA